MIRLLDNLKRSHATPGSAEVLDLINLAITKGKIGSSGETQFVSGFHTVRHIRGQNGFKGNVNSCPVVIKSLKFGDRLATGSKKMVGLLGQLSKFDRTRSSSVALPARDIFKFDV